MQNSYHTAILLAAIGALYERAGYLRAEAHLAASKDALKSGEMAVVAAAKTLGMEARLPLIQRVFKVAWQTKANKGANDARTALAQTRPAAASAWRDFLEEAGSRDEARQRLRRQASDWRGALSEEERARLNACQAGPAGVIALAQAKAIMARAAAVQDPLAQRGAFQVARAALDAVEALETAREVPGIGQRKEALARALAWAAVIALLPYERRKEALVTARRHGVEVRGSDLRLARRIFQQLIKKRRRQGQ